MTRELMRQVTGHKLPNGERIHTCQEGREDYKTLKLAGRIVLVAMGIVGGLLIF